MLSNSKRQKLIIFILSLILAGFGFAKQTSAAAFLPSGTLTSSAIDTGWNWNADFTTLGFTITTPPGTALRFQLRSAVTEAGLATAVWHGPTGTADFYTITGTAINPVHDGHRWIQYRAHFSTTDTSVTPRLFDITIHYTDNIAFSPNSLLVSGDIGVRGNIWFNNPIATTSIAGGLLVDINTLFVDAAANRVGIGTPAPTQPLHVVGNIRFTGVSRAADGATTAPAYTFELDPDTGLFRPADNVLAIATAGSERMRIDATGNVGIGTTAPGGALDIRVPGTAGAWDRLVVTGTNEWGDGVNYVTIGSGGASGIMLSNPHITWRGGAARVRMGRVGGVIGGAFWDAGLTSTDRWDVARNEGPPFLSINSAGNVGIGTAAPAHRADIRSVLGIASPVASPANFLAIWAEADTDHPAIIYPSTRRLRIGTWASYSPGAAWTERVSIDPTGNVGIGTATPLARLDVHGTVRNIGGGLILSLATPAAPTVTPVGATGTITYGYRITARSTVGETLASPEATTTTGNNDLTTANFNRITWTAVPGAVDYRVYRTTTTSTLETTTGLIGTTPTLVFDDTGLIASGAVPTIDTSGNVGIATTTPTNILTVVQFSVTDPIADAWTVFSTPGSKIILGKADDKTDYYLELFRNLSVYQWRRTENEPIRISVIADENTPPEILAFDSEGNIQGVDLLGYIGFLHEVMKGQQKQIDALSVEENEEGKIVKSDLQQRLAGLGLVVTKDGILEVRKLKAEVARIQRLEMVDQTTGKIFCAWIENGEWVKRLGECQDALINVDTGPITADNAEIVPADPLPAEAPSGAEEGAPVAPAPAPAPAPETPTTE